MYLAEKGEKSQARVENLDELVTACRQYQRPDELEDMSDLSAFLAHAALESGENQADEYADAVQLMTLHSAKGWSSRWCCWSALRKACSPASNRPRSRAGWKRSAASVTSA
jgi:hypothetical protein